MDVRKSLLAMLRKLLEDMHAIQQLGAGYYACIPVIRRYNKLLSQAGPLFDDSNGLIGTFEEQTESEPKDPAEKMKVIQGIRIEIGQLMSLLESMEEDGD